MNIIISISIIITLIISLIIISVFYIKNKYMQYFIRLEQANINIENNLKKKFDILNRSINIIKANTDIEKDILEDIVKLRSRKLNNYDFDIRLSNSMNEFNELKETYHNNLNSCTTFTKLYLELNNIEEKLLSTKSYYNNVIIKYDKLIKTFPSNLIGKIFRYKENHIYKCNNTYDEIFNTFNI